jgi:hypothetical protein
MKRFKEISEQHREKGKFKPVKPYNVADVSPRPSSDSANVNLKEEGWSQKYKNSIDCNNPKGFSQKAHCAGKKKTVSEDLILIIPRVVGKELILKVKLLVIVQENQVNLNQSVCLMHREHLYQRKKRLQL